MSQQQGRAGSGQQPGGGRQASSARAPVQAADKQISSSEGSLGSGHHQKGQATQNTSTAPKSNTPANGVGKEESKSLPSMSWAERMKRGPTGPPKNGPSPPPRSTGPAAAPPKAATLPQAQEVQRQSPAVNAAPIPAAQQPRPVAITQPPQPAPAPESYRFGDIDPAELQPVMATRKAPEAALGQGPPPAPAAAKAEAPRDVPIPVGIAPVAVRTPGVSTAPGSGPLPSSAAAPANRERSSANSTPQSRGRAGEAAPFSRPGPIPPSPSSSAGGSSANVAMHGPNRTPPYHTGQMQAQHRAFVPGSGHRGPSPTAPRGPHQGGSPNLGMNMHYPGAMQGYGAYAYAPGPGYAQHGWQANLQQYAYYPNYGGVPPQYPNYLDQQAGPGQQGGGQQGSLPHVQHGVPTGRGGPPPQGHYAPPTGAPHAQGGSSGPAPPPPQQQQGQGQPAKHVPIKRERRVLVIKDPSTNEAVDLSDVKPAAPTPAGNGAAAVAAEKSAAAAPIAETAASKPSAPAVKVTKSAADEVPSNAPAEAAAKAAAPSAVSKPADDKTTKQAAKVDVPVAKETASPEATTVPEEKAAEVPEPMPAREVPAIAAAKEEAASPPAESPKTLTTGAQAPAASVNKAEPVALVSKAQPTAPVSDEEPAAPAIKAEPAASADNAEAASVEEVAPAVEAKDAKPSVTPVPSAHAGFDSTVSKEEETSEEDTSDTTNEQSADEDMAPTRPHVPVPEGRKRYEAEALLSLSAFCQDPPKGFNAAQFALEITRPAHHAGGSHHERGGGGVGGGPGGGSSWNKGPRGANAPMGGGFGHGPAAGGPRGGPPRGRAPPNMVGVDGDVWQRGQALPPMPQDHRNDRGNFGGRPGGGRSGGPNMVLHKTESAYKVGAYLSEDPEEEKAQKALKSMLNKITPDNFDKIKGQIVAQIDERKRAATLQSFIDQIFDKALTETSFSELYASLVKELKDKLPRLTDESGEVVEFRRALLNKCQDEFQEGVVAMKAVAERELRSKDGAAPDEEKDDAEEGEIEHEQGEVSQKATALELKRAERAAAKAEVEARKRMLGNIIFVGQLFCRGVLTEKVMHSCIQQLLDETENPRPEDVECLSKLMVTVGNLLDHSVKIQRIQTEGGGERKAPSKELMDMYFQRIGSLAQNAALDSRHKFMLQDMVELRRNKWVLRRKAEGPKKIDDIHKDAENEARMRAAMDRQPSRGMRDMPRGGPSSRPSYVDNRVEGPFRPMHRVSSQDTMGAGQSLRPHGRAAPPARDARPTVKQDRPAAAAPAQETAAARPPTPPPVEPAADVKSATATILQEWESLKDLKEAELGLVELLEKRNVPAAAVVDALLNAVLFLKGVSYDSSVEFFQLDFLREKLTQRQFQEGAHILLSNLVDRLEDKPVAVTLTGELLGTLVNAGLLDFSFVAKDLLSADLEAIPEGDDSQLVDSGNAIKVIGAFLRTLSKIEGAEAAKTRLSDSGLKLADYLPAFERDNEEVLQKAVDKFELANLL
ncbi:hypothetical protein ACKKBF_B01825 [Auxenochlorella protothecoides x Auxenochlorella symbiontica]